MKRILLIFQVFTLLLITTGLVITGSKAEGEGVNNRTVALDNMLDNGDFSDETFLPEGIYGYGFPFYKYYPEADVVLKGGWVTHINFTGGDDVALSIVDGVAKSDSASTQTKTIFRYQSPQWVIDAGYLEALPLEVDTTHRYYFSAETWADGDGGSTDYDTSFSVTALGVDIYSITDENAPIVPTTFTGIIEAGEGSSDGYTGVTYSSYCQYGCPSTEKVNADNFMLFDLTATFGDYEVTIEEFETILTNNNIEGYVDYEYITFLDPDVNGDIKTLDTLISAVYEPFTMTDYLEDTHEEENHIDALPVLNTVYGNSIPTLNNVFGNYLENFYLKTNRTYTDQVNSTYGDITPLDYDSILTEVKGLSLNQIVINGNFALDGNSDGLADNFVTVSSPITTLSNGEQTVENTDGIGNKRIEYIFDTTIGGLYYLQFEGKLVSGTTGNGINLYVGNSYNGFSLSSDYETYSVIGTSTIDDGTARIQFGVASVIGKISIKNVKIIPIDNTPLASKTAGEIDLIVGDYFEGYDYITDFTLESTGKNLFDTTTKLYGSNAIAGFGNIGEFIGNDISLDPVEGAGVELYLNAGVHTISFTPDTTFAGTALQIALTDNSDVKVSINTSLIADTRQSLQLTTSKSGLFKLGFGAFSGITVLLQDIQIEEGITSTTYEDYNSSTLSLTTDLLSVGDVQDRAYNDNGTWYKDQYVDRDYNNVVKNATTWTVDTELTNTIRFYKDLTSLLDYVTPATANVYSNIKLVINGVTHSVTTMNLSPTGDFESVALHTSNLLLIRVDKSKLGGITSADFEAYLQANNVEFIFELTAPILDTEIVHTGSLISESVTTLRQLNNFATEYSIDFITSLDTTNTDYYYSEIDNLLVNLDSDYGNGYEPTSEYFEATLDYLNIVDYTGQFSDYQYLSNFELEMRGTNLYDNTLEYTIGRLQTNGVLDTNYFDGGVTDFIPIEPLTDYIINHSSSATYNHCFYNASFLLISCTSAGSPTFTSTSSAFYVKLNIAPRENIATLQLNEGSILRPYSEYNATTNFRLEVELLRIKGIRDRAYSANEDLIIGDKEVWYKDQYLGRDFNNVVQSATSWIPSDELTDTIIFKKVLTGSLDYVSNTLTTTLNNLYLNIGDINFNNNTSDYLLSNDVEGVAIDDSGQLTIRILKSKLTGITSIDFQNYLQANDVEFIYELDTPILATEITYTGGFINEATIMLEQLNNMATEYQIDFMVEAPYLATRYYEDITEINPFYQYDDYALSALDEPTINLSLIETMEYEIDSYPEIYIAKYDIEGNYIADIYENYIYDFTISQVFRLHTFDYTLPIASASETMYMWIAYNGKGGSVMGAGYVARETSTGFNTLEAGIRTLDYALGINDTVYSDIATGYQYDHTTEDYVIDSDNPIVIANFKNTALDESSIVFYNETTEDSYSYSIDTIKSDFSYNSQSTYKAVNSYVIFSTSNELLGSMNYLLGLNVVNDFIEDLDVTMTDYTNIFNNYSDLGVFTYNLMDGVTILAKGEAPIFYGGNPYILNMTNHSVRFGNIVNILLTKSSINFDNEYTNYFIYDSNSAKYFTDVFDTFLTKNYLRYILYEGFNINEATITYKAETEETYLNGTEAGDYYIQIEDTYEMRGATGIQDGVDNWLDSIGLTDSTSKGIVSFIVIVGFTILLFALKQGFVTVLIVDFGIIGLLALLGFIPLWFILVIIIVVMVLIFFMRRE